MTTQVSARRPGSEAGLRAWPSAWYDLARRVRDFDPDVVVLVARKMPRIAEVLELEFPSRALYLADVAIPFSLPELTGRRIAIIDDVVNYGSTVSNAVAEVSRTRPREVAVFAIGRRAHSVVPTGVSASFSVDEPLSDNELADFVWRVPDVLSLLAKPYDLDFPIIPCQFELPFSGFDELLHLLKLRFGTDRTFDLSSPVGVNAGVFRASVDLGGPHLRKLRVYYDSGTGTCNVVPMTVTRFLPTSQPEEGSWSRLFWDLLGERVEVDHAGNESTALEQAARIRLFGDSLEFGLKALGTLRDVLAPTSLSEPFNAIDAGLLFGPQLMRAAEFATDELTASLLDAPLKPVDSFGGDGESESLLAEDQDFVEAVRSRLTRDSSIEAAPLRTVFQVLFEELATAVGAQNPSQYRLKAPYRQEEIARRPYLRLRVGLSLSDLVRISSLFLNEAAPDEGFRFRLSRLLDEFIDQGAVVPTFMNVNGQIQRVYRKGEPDPRDRSLERGLYAWRLYGKGLSWTRFSKLMTALRYTDEELDGLEPTPRQRGTGCALTPSVLDEPELELAQHLAMMGKIRRERTR